jgi:hypothetical protein
MRMSCAAVPVADCLWVSHEWQTWWALKRTRVLPSRRLLVRE